MCHPSRASPFLLGRFSHRFRSGLRCDVPLGLQTSENWPTTDLMRQTPQFKSLSVNDELPSDSSVVAFLLGLKQGSDLVEQASKLRVFTARVSNKFGP
jgi:hypothetical protein